MWILVNSLTLRAAIRLTSSRPYLLLPLSLPCLSGGQAPTSIFINNTFSAFPVLCPSIPNVCCCLSSSFYLIMSQSKMIFYAVCIISVSYMVFSTYILFINVTVFVAFSFCIRPLYLENWGGHVRYSVFILNNCQLWIQQIRAWCWDSKDYIEISHVNIFELSRIKDFRPLDIKVVIL